MLQDDTKSVVPTAYYDMFYLRLLGFTHKQIAEKTEYSESHIRRLFAQNGALNDLWQGWLKTAKENAVDEALTMMFGNLLGVVGALINTAQSGGLSSVAASRILLGYTLGDPAKRTEQQTDKETYHPNTLAEWVMISHLRSEGVSEAEIMKRAAQIKKPNYG